MTSIIYYIYTEHLKKEQARIEKERAKRDARRKAASESPDTGCKT